MLIGNPIDSQECSFDHGRQVMLRVTDLDASIQYYTECLGCTLLRKKDNPEYKYTLAFLGYGPEDENCVFELTYNWCARAVDLFLIYV